VSVKAPKIQCWRSTWYPAWSYQYLSNVTFRCMHEWPQPDQGRHEKL
jgi:hypothetical protein